MKNIRSLAPVAALALLGMAGCNFLTAGETQTDPNRPTLATSRQLLIGAQANIWGFWGSDPARIAGILAYPACTLTRRPICFADSFTCLAHSA